MDKYVSVIGGSHVAVGAISYGRLVDEGNFGVVSLKLGGEARNLSERLALSGVNVKLITALGRDFFAERIKSVCDKLGIDYSSSLHLDAPTSAVVEIVDDAGESDYKVVDHRVLRNMDMKFLASRLEILNAAEACYVDTEFDSDKLEFLFPRITSPIFADTQSIRASSKLKTLLKYIHTLKPNKGELENLVGFSLANENNFLAATEIVLKAGVKRVFVTCGKDGVWYNDGTNFGHVAADSAIVVSKVGVGGAFNAALIKGFLEGKDTRRLAEDAVKVASEFISGDNIVNI